MIRKKTVLFEIARNDANDCYLMGIWRGEGIQISYQVYDDTKKHGEYFDDFNTAIGYFLLTHCPEER